MTAVLDPVIVNPCADTELSEVQALLDNSTDIRITDGDTEVKLSQALASVLRDAVSAMTNGQFVTVTSLNQVMTTQQAADFLGVSRPTIVKFLDEGRIPSTRPNHHRRVRLQDLITFRDRLPEERRALLADMISESQSFPHFGGDFVETR